MTLKERTRAKFNALMKTTSENDIGSTTLLSKPYSNSSISEGSYGSIKEGESIDRVAQNDIRQNATALTPSSFDPTADGYLPYKNELPEKPYEISAKVGSPTKSTQTSDVSLSSRSRVSRRYSSGANISIHWEPGNVSDGSISSISSASLERVRSRRKSTETLIQKLQRLAASVEEQQKSLDDESDRGDNEDVVRSDFPSQETCNIPSQETCNISSQETCNIPSQEMCNIPSQETCVPSEDTSRSVLSEEMSRSIPSEETCQEITSNERNEEDVQTPPVLSTPPVPKRRRNIKKRENVATVSSVPSLSTSELQKSDHDSPMSAPEMTTDLTKMTKLKRTRKMKKVRKARKEKIDQLGEREKEIEAHVEAGKTNLIDERLSETVTTTDIQSSEMESLQETETVVDGEKDVDGPHEVLGITVHGMNGIKMNCLISHPIVQVHVIDLETGTYLKKKNMNKPVTYIYENKSGTPMQYIMPLMTQPYNMKVKKSLVPEWQELLIFNEDYEYFVKDMSQVMLIFEVLDFVSMQRMKKKWQNFSRLEEGWHRVAWAFLKLVGSNCKPNSGTIRLQLFYPLKRMWNVLAKPSFTEIFSWWNKKNKRKYPFTLLVTIQGVFLPQVRPGLRSMIPTQEEEGKVRAEDFLKSLEVGRPVISAKKLSALEIIKQKIIPKWTRLAGQPCKIPDRVLLKLSAGKNGCFTVKFSHNGQYLACACIENNAFPIFLYDIPTGELQGKFFGHTGIVYDLQWTADDRTLLSASGDCSLRVWSLNASIRDVPVLPHPSYVYTIAYHPTELSLIVSGCYDGIVRVWDLASVESEYMDKLLAQLDHHKGFINASCFDAVGEKLFTGDGSGVICVWNTADAGNPENWSLITEVHLPSLMNSIINHMVCHPIAQRLLISSRSDCIVMMDSRRFTEVQHFKGLRNNKAYLHISVTPCGSFVLSGSEDGCIYVWNTLSGELLHTCCDSSYQDVTISAVDFHPYEHMFASCVLGDFSSVFVYIHTPKKKSAHQLPLVEKTDEYMRYEAYEPPLPKQPSVGILKNTSSGSRMDINEVVANDMKTRSTSSLGMKSDSINATLSTTPVLTEEQSEVTTRLTRNEDKQRNVTFEDQIQRGQKWKLLTRKMNEIIISSSSSQETSQLAESNSALNLQSKFSSTTTSEMSLPIESKSSSMSLSSTTSSEIPFKAVALYSYISQNNTELSLRPGDVLSVTRRFTDHWWEGTKTDGQLGLFPANYVYVTEESESVTSSSSLDGADAN